MLVPEQDIMLTGIQPRRPDLVFFNKFQIDNSENEEVISEFAIEVISTNDQINAVKAKLEEYFNHGVKVAWLIYTEQKLRRDMHVLQNCSDLL